MESSDHPLRVMRESLNLSIDGLAEATGVSARTILRAEQSHVLQPGSRRLLCQFFKKSAEELGLLPQQQRLAQRSMNALQFPDPIIVAVTEAQAAILLGDTDSMKNRFDESRRALLWQMLMAGATLTTAPHSVVNSDLLERLVRVFANPTRIDETTIVYLEQLIAGYWQKSNESQAEVVEQALPFYLPKLTALAHQSSPFQRRAAHLAAQGYILAAEVDRANVGAMKAYAQQGVLYAQIAEDPNIQAAALKQQATMYLVDKAPDLALQKYTEALPLVRTVSPLLQSRIYLGLASAYARCGSLHKQDAQRYLGLARDGFPEHPEADANYLYTVCGRSVLHFYEALTYMDLHQPDDAWLSLSQVDGVHPKLPTPESTRIEIINLQARTAAAQGNMEQSIAYWLAGIDAATALGYSIWKEEATEVYSYLCERWPHEVQVQALASHLEVA
jgi:transcriptional regulator with XRE-family HTH domain